MSKLKLWAPIFLVMGALTWLSPASGISASDSPLAGVVRSADGQPMEGVAVSARADGRRTSITTTVYTDRSGAYSFSPLAAPMDAGRYRVWAQAVGFEASRSSATLSADKRLEQNFALKPLKDFGMGKQLSGVEWLASLPENTPEDRRLKRILFVNCTQCHASGFVLQNRFDAAGWRIILDVMEQVGHTAARSGSINPYVRAYKEELVAYLTRVRGPDSELTYKPLPRVTGEATRIVVTEYDISPGHLPGYQVVGSGSDWSQGTPPRNESGAAHDAIVASGGYVWLADSLTPERTLAKLDPKTGRVTDYKHFDREGVPVNTHDIIEDKNGNIWFNNNVEGTIDKFDPRTEQFQHFPRPASLPSFGNGLIDLDSKGNVWAGVGGGGIVKKHPDLGINYRSPDPQQPGGTIKLDTRTGEYTFYAAVAPTMRSYGAGVDAHDNVYFTQPGPDRLGVVDGRSGRVDVISLERFDEDFYTEKDFQLGATFEGTDHFGPVWQKGPRRQQSDKNGASHYVTLSKGGAIAKIDIRTRRVTEYPLPHRYSFPYHLAVDKNHMVWVSGLNTDRVFRFNPFTEKFTEYELPTRGTDVRFVAVDNRTDPPEVWLAYYQTSKMARIQFRTAAASSTAATR